MPARSLLILAGLLASAAAAAPAHDPQFGTHAVIQRGRPIVLSGSAAPNATVTIGFAGERKSAAADGGGRWQATFAPKAAGGPYSIELNGALAATDVIRDG